MIEQFNAADTELTTGINLIEASAGTGKTYTIALLVLRFIVEKQMQIDQLLIVTFTNAATDELKARIRQRLADARLCLSGAGEGDAVVSEWLNSLAMEKADIKQCIDNALLEIDQAEITTIHGFCQRALNEHALESGQLFDCELSGDISAIQQACADDYWRRWLYQCDSRFAAILMAEFKTPADLLGTVVAVSPHEKVYPEAEDLSTLARQLDQIITELQPLWRKHGAATLEKIQTGKFKKDIIAFAEQAQTKIGDWLNGESDTPPECEWLTEQGLLNNLNGNKLRGEEKKQLYLQELDITLCPFFEQLEAIIQRIQLAFRRGLLEALRSEVDTVMRKQNVMSFDDLIGRLAEALNGEKGRFLSEALQQRYQTALIDEFQDTDSNQWAIFSTLFSGGQHYLYLIGDPKQAIYKFRGADIASYFAAQQQAQHHFTLANNWRSHPGLVDGVNQLFKRQQAFYSPELAFYPVNAAMHKDDGALWSAQQAVTPLQLIQLDAFSEKTSHWKAKEAKSQITIAVVDQIVKLLNQDYRVQKSDDSRPVKPQDIAILVRDNESARLYKQALLSVGAPSVINQKQSVFATEQAQQLYQLLQAIVYAGDADLLKQALTVPWFGIDGRQLYGLVRDDSAMAEWMQRFMVYQQRWREKGLLSMMLALFEEHQLEKRLAGDMSGERLISNLQQLIELLQQAILEHQLGMNKALDWLNQAVLNSQTVASDEQQMRLESDAAAVSIITLHSAKGLEYPIVFCPDLWRRSNRLNLEKKLIKCHQQGAMIADLGSEDFEKRRQIALQEELAEDIRLFYVAVTRAKYVCYLYWANVRTQKQANQSAMAYLLQFAEADHKEQVQRLTELASDSDDAIAHHLLDQEIALSETYQQTFSNRTLTARQKQRKLYSIWQMSSYTALSALSHDDAPELPETKADEQPLVVTDEAEETEGLPKGAATGNALHQILEDISFQKLAIGGLDADYRAKVCTRYGLAVDRPELIDQMLEQSVNTPLAEDSGFALKDLDEKQCLKEMPFYLSMKTVDVSGINSILQDCPAFKPLNAKQMSGYLTGFIDLICCYHGRYYVMDYKSNSLQNYQAESLTEAMREHNYGLQYWLYTLVLHRHLQNRLPSYDYQQHFGGVKYLFLRGMEAEQAGSGVYQDKPGLEKLQALADLFF